MDFSPWNLFAGFLFGVIGAYLIKRGRSDAHIPHILIGAGLIIYPYFIENPYLLWGVGASLVLIATRI